MSNNLISDTPRVTNVHPITVAIDQVYNQNNNDFSGLLPAVSVELIEDADYQKESLGYNTRSYEVTSDKLTELESIALKDRTLLGEIVPTTSIDKMKTIQQANEAAGGYYIGTSNSSLLSQRVQISVWADSGTVRNILHKVTRALLYRVKRYLINKVKNMNIVGVANLYNLETGRTLYGSEFTVSFINYQNLVEMPDVDGLNTITDVEGYLRQNLINYIDDDTPENDLDFRAVGDE